MPKRKTQLVNEGTYHIFTHSIAGENIFKKEEDYNKFLKRMLFYNNSKVNCAFSSFPLLDIKEYARICNTGKKLVQILSYCLMPTHMHLILKQKQDKGISLFMHKLLTSYTRDVNSKYKRQGPLFKGRFNSVEILTNEQLIHTTGYIHVNPILSSGVNHPENWKYSSLKEYLNKKLDGFYICDIPQTIKFHDYHKNMVRNMVISHIKLKNKKKRKKEVVLNL